MINKIRGKKVFALVVTLAMVFSGIMMTNVKGVYADGNQEKYYGFTTTQDGYDEAIYVAKNGGGDKTNPNAAGNIVAYCFNHSFATPSKPDGTKFPEYDRIIPSAQNMFDISTNARETNPEELYKKINNVLYNGYPHDASDIQGSLTNGRFRAVTQYAIWYYTDGNQYNVPNLGTDEKAAFDKLVGITKGAKEAPDNITFAFYKNTGKVKASTAEGAAKPEFQNLISSTPVDKVSGKEVPIEVTANIFAKKVWEGVAQGTNKPEVTFVLKKKVDDSIVAEKTVTTKADSNESSIVEFENIKGKVKDYKVEEKNIPTGYMNKGLSGNGTKDNPFVITNVKNAMKYLKDVVVVKNWVNLTKEEGEKQGLYFALYKKQGNDPEELVTVDASGTKIENPMAYSVSKELKQNKYWTNLNLPVKKDEEAIEYIVKEVNKDGSAWLNDGFKVKAPDITSNSTTLMYAFTNTKTETVVPDDQGKDEGNKPDVTPDDQGKDDGNKPDVTKDNQGKDDGNKPDVTPDDQGKDDDNKPDVNPDDQGKDDGNKPDVTPDDQGKDDGNKPDVTKDDQGSKKDLNNGTIPESKKAKKVDAKSDKNIVNTGDQIRMGIYVFVGLVAALICVLILRKKKK